MSILYRGPSKDTSYQISIHLANWLQKRRLFRNQPIGNKNCLWWPCLLTDHDEMSNLYRGHAIRPNQLVREVFMFASKFAEISHLTCMWDNKSDFLCLLLALLYIFILIQHSWYGITTPFLSTYSFSIKFLYYFISFS